MRESRNDTPVTALAMRKVCQPDSSVAVPSCPASSQPSFILAHFQIRLPAFPSSLTIHHILRISFFSSLLACQSWFLLTVAKNLIHYVESKITRADLIVQKWSHPCTSCFICFLRLPILPRRGASSRPYSWWSSRK